MSSFIVKTEYNIEGDYGSTEKLTLYAKHNNSCDVVTFLDENGKYIFSVGDTMDNNLIDAINRLYAPHKKSMSSEYIEGVERLNDEDKKLCGW